MKKLLVILILIFIAPSFVFCQQGWITHEIGNIDSIYVYLKVKEYASVADDKWIAFEFDNRANDSIISKDWCSFTIERKAYGWSGNLAQEINLYPFIRIKSDSSIIPPGKIIYAAGMSEQGSCMLGIPPKNSDTTEVLCNLRFSMPLAGGKKLDIKHFKFSFNWYYPTDAQFEFLSSRLKAYLFLEKYNYYYYSMLMSNRRIADAVPAEIFMKALTETKKDFNFRVPILQYLDSAYNNDENVINYFVERIEKDISPIHRDLQNLKNISLRLYKEILTYFKLKINDNSKRYNILLWYRRYKDLLPKKSDNVTETIINHSLLTENLDSLSKVDLNNWKILVNDLKLVKDTLLIPYLLPMLKDKRILQNTHWNVFIRSTGRSSQIRFPTYRACDLVLETIYKLKGINSSKFYEHIFIDSNGKKIYSAKSVEEHNKHCHQISAIRDRHIKQLLHEYSGD